MCIISATEFKTNFGKYLKLANKEQIAITKNGKIITTMFPPKNDEWDDFFNEFTGIAKEEDVDLNDPRIAHMLGKL